MPTSSSRVTGNELTDQMTGSIRTRIKLLVFMSTLVVALAFGLSFYFALIANESAISKQIPELEAVVSKLKNLLTINTVGFVAILIGSFYLLSQLITARMFRPLGFIQKDLMSIADGTIPKLGATEKMGAFTNFNSAFRSALFGMRERENKEIEELKSCIDLLSRPSGISEAKTRIDGIIKAKGAALGIVEGEKEDTGTDIDESDPLFMQPV
jgi:hypothetical protein